MTLGNGVIVLLEQVYKCSFLLFSFNISINFTFVAVKQTKTTAEEEDIFADSSLNKKPASTTKTNDKKQEEVSF